jgi:uncharacterized protein (DUF427 family)
MKATFNERVIAEGETVNIEGYEYFRPEDVNMEFLKKNNETYTCSWKGICDFYDVAVGDKTDKGAAWIYPAPKPEAANIAGKMAFGMGVAVGE